MWHYLDPDYRRNPPNDKPHCCRCQKQVDPDKAIRVELNEDYTHYRVNNDGKYYLGADCYKITNKK